MHAKKGAQKGAQNSHTPKPGKRINDVQKWSSFISLFTTRSVTLEARQLSCPVQYTAKCHVYVSVKFCRRRVASVKEEMA